MFSMLEAYRLLESAWAEFVEMQAIGSYDRALAPDYPERERVLAAQAALLESIVREVVVEVPKDGLEDLPRLRVDPRMDDEL